MIHSMTGYGKAQTEIIGKKITVEIRSLNSKQLDLSIKSPSIYRERENFFRAEIAKRIQRGKVDLFINVEETGDSGVCPVNAAAFKNYYAQIQGITSELGISSDSGELIAAILRMPDVMQTERQEVDPAEYEALDAAVSGAIDRLVEFRTQEGKVLISDLLHRVDLIENLKEQVPQYESERIETIKNRIRENIASLNIPFDSNRLEQELIFYIEKLDVTEEKVRLSNHCRYFREVVDTEDFPGRKLAFITQEMGREINTLGSKANHAEIQRLVVRMKDELEKIKEQLLNLL